MPRLTKPAAKKKPVAKKKTAAKKKPATRRSRSSPVKSTSITRVHAPRSRFEAARTGTENTNHWAGSDSLSPNGAADPTVRKTLRERARYEVANNPFAFGAANAIAEDAIGTGPRLQLMLPNESNEQAARQVEQAWQSWVDATGLGETLRLLYRGGAVDGETFGLTIDNPKVDHPVQLDFRVIEADRVTDPWGLALPSELVDGIEFDQYGNPTQYTVLREHPGDGTGWGVTEFDVYPAQQVYHWFRADRPGQARGVSWLTPALPLFAQLRRYTLAVLSAAELAANLAGVLKSTVPAYGDGEPPEIEDMDEVPFPRGTLLTLPPGWDATGFKAEQPTTQFGDFRTQILVEIGRCLDLPLNRITGNSSGYNYSSGRLDHLTYHAAVWRHRDRLRLRILDRLFRAWLDEATLVGILPAGLPPFAEWAWDWQWDAFGDIDPQKEAAAAQALLDGNLTDLAEQCAARGRRWDQVLRQRAKEKALMDELGLTPAPAPSPAAINEPPPDEEEEDDEDDSDMEGDEETEEEEVAADG